MSKEHIEYDRDVNPYPSIGKMYNGEKAIISLTSWKERINAVTKTLYSLLKNCPDFHIVLVLSEEEFPLKEKELPEDLMLFVENDFIELLWVYKNYKSFKKVMFTMDKYRDVPIISADDDCIYTCNYAQILYDVWNKNKKCCVSNKVFNAHNFIWTQGASTLYSPYCFKNLGIKNRNLVFTCKSSNDDAFIGALYKKMSIKCVMAKFKTLPFIFHDTNKSLSPKSDGSGYDAKKDLSTFFKGIQL